MAGEGHLLGRGVLGDGLRSLGDGVLGQFSGQQQPDGRLDFPGGDGGPLVVVSQSGSFGRYSLEDVIDEGVHDGHGLRGNAGVGVHLLQHLVDVNAVTLLPPPFPLLISLRDGFLGLSGLLRSFT